MDTSLYIYEIKALNHPFIKVSDVNILIPDEEKKNIIITGKNGSGKSSLLRAIKGNIGSYSSSRNNNPNPNFSSHIQAIANAKSQLDAIGEGSPAYNRAKNQYHIKLAGAANLGALVDIKYSDAKRFMLKQDVLGYFEAKRLTSLTKPSNISSPHVDNRQIGDHAAGQLFIQHLVNRRSQLAFALEDQADTEAQSIRNWFDQLDNLFSKLFDQKLKLKFLRNELDFVLEDENQNIIDLKTLSDGYSAIVSMVTEIIIRMEAISYGGLNVSGIVLIDEIETHLHVSLQRKVFPFLSEMFPNIQFIVTTHSPFILSSVQDAIVFDLESGETIDQEDALWAYSYEALVEGYFEAEKFSVVLEEKIKEYKDLIDRQDSLDRTEKKQLRKLTKELNNVPLYKNEAIELELKKLGLK